MKKYYQYFGLALIMVFSFYYTEKIAAIILNKNPLMVTINNEKASYNVEAVNAEINGDYITPGINGLQVNARESFYKMQEADVFNKYFLVFEQDKPDISLEDNKDKIIKNGNKLLNKVSIILETENEVSDYLKANNIKASMLTNLDDYQYNNYFEVINNEVEGFKSLENTLNLNKENKHICVINDYNMDICLKHKNYLIDPTLKLNTSNLKDIKSKIGKGSIILINKNVSLIDVKLLLKEIKFKDLEIVYVSEIISEINNN
ncbi:MAG: hypothetical protein E7163_02680 [Firmicutes bacterium]|nr:hypothetical protein [Bacillota bacterium]